MEVIPMTTTRLRPAERRIEAIALAQQITDEYPEDIEIPTQMAFRESLLPRYQNVQTSQVVLVIPR